MKNVYSGTNGLHRTTAARTMLVKNIFDRNKKIFFIKKLLLFFIIAGVLAAVLHGISVAGKSVRFSERQDFTGRQNLSDRQDLSEWQNLSDRQELLKYYTSITIQPGDTLWSIAEEYMPEEYTDTKEYIEEIMELNHLHSFKIHSGGALVIPYY